jgi:hypothetical protein
MTRHFGILVPSTNTTVEAECRLLPPNLPGAYRAALDEYSGLEGPVRNSHYQRERPRRCAIRSSWKRKPTAATWSVYRRCRDASAKATRALRLSPTSARQIALYIDDCREAGDPIPTEAGKEFVEVEAI